jgi:hypothetical protein
MRLRPAVTLLSLALALAPLAASAHHRTGHAGGPPAASQNAGQGVGRGGCPRGLAAQAQPCKPPGQARRSVTPPPPPAPPPPPPPEEG